MTSTPGYKPLIDCFYSLLTSALRKRQPVSADFENLTASDWNEIYIQSRRQTVTALTFSGLCHLPDALLPPEKLLMQWLAESEVIRRRSLSMDKAVKSLTEELSGTGIRAILLKGQAIAALYPEPETRQCGDIDLFVPNAADIVKITETAGTADSVRHADGSTSFTRNGVTVEIHPRLLDIHSHKSLRRLSAFPSLNTFSESRLAGGFSVTIPSPQATLLMLSAHIFKHAAGRGIGLRQLCDMAVASRHYAPMIRSGEMDAIFRAAGLARWNRMLYSFLSLRLGLEAEYVPLSGDFTPSAKLASRLEKIILDGGNFGRHASGIASRRGPVATALSFLRRARFAFAIAPRETSALILTIIKGRLSK